jgi:uncharacterized alkaline shock family protein YloU
MSFGLSEVCIKGYNEVDGIYLQCEGGGFMSVVLLDGPIGKVSVSEHVVNDIVKFALKSIDGLKKIKKSEISLYKGEMIVNLIIICDKQVFIKRVIDEIQNSVNIQIEKWLGISVLSVNVTI